MTEQLVQARYLGDTPIVIPDLLGWERPDRADQAAAWEAGGNKGVNPHCLVEHGDVIPLDRFSAEGRSDFQIVKGKKES